MSKLEKLLEDFLGFGKLEIVSVKQMKANQLIHKYRLQRIASLPLENIKCNIDVISTIGSLASKEYNTTFRVCIELDDKDIEYENHQVKSSYFPYEASFLIYFFDDRLIVMQENLSDAFKLQVVDGNPDEYLCDKNIIKLFI